MWSWNKRKVAESRNSNRDTSSRHGLAAAAAAVTTTHSNGTNYWLRNNELIENEVTAGSFHVAMRTVLVVGQCFGAVPVCGVSSSSSHSNGVLPVHFKWTAARTVYTLTLIGMATIETGFCVYEMALSGVNFATIGSLTFYSLAMVSLGFMLQLAIKWPHLMALWHHLERDFGGVISMPTPVRSIASLEHCAQNGLSKRHQQQEKQQQHHDDEDEDHESGGAAADAAATVNSIHKGLSISRSLSLRVKITFLIFSAFSLGR